MPGYFTFKLGDSNTNEALKRERAVYSLNCNKLNKTKCFWQKYQERL